MDAGNICTKPFDPMRKAVRNEEFERAVSGRRLLAEPCLPQPVEEFVGRQCPMALEQCVEDTGPRRRQAKPPLAAVCLHRRPHCLATAAMIMRPERIAAKSGCEGHLLQYNACYLL